MRYKNEVGKRFGRLVALEPIRRNNRIYWSCQCDCGVVRVVEGRSMRKGLSKSCGCLNSELVSQRMLSQKGDKHPSWKGGIKRHWKGYTLTWAGDHPDAKQGYIFTHRLVMERHIGRRLRQDETVHHLNGIRDDNRIENLELWSKSQPYGQRIEDKIAWAVDFLQQHGYKVDKS